MAENPRIEDLRKRYHENPRRFFAPLANEYRKSGFLDRALLLCQKHVPEQPENMNGLVVYGQTLFESNLTDQAREPFERALALDPENLIALRHLGDIARINGDVPAAKGWYEKVLEFDRRNDEVLDLLAQLGGSDTPAPEPVRPSTAASAGLVSFSDSVSMSGGQDLGMIDLDAPAEAPSAKLKPAGPGKTVVINAQALADRDRAEAVVAEKVTQPVASIPSGSLLDPPSVEAPSARPSKRASLLDINFDFDETKEAEAPLVAPAAPVTGAEAAEYGFSSALEVETSGDVAPLAPPPPGDFELAEFNAEVSPLAGLEATEFTSDEVAPLADLDADTASASLSAVAPLDGLDRVNVTVEDVAPLSGLADLPLIDEASASPISDLPLLDDASAAPIVEAPSAGRPKPRMTKASMASLPLLADFGLEEDEPASSKATPILTPIVPPPVEHPSAPSASARASKATPTFVTETMAALYVQQGHLPEAIDVYRQLVEQSPADAGLKAKLAELQRMHASEQMPAPKAAEEEMPEFEVPAYDAPEPAPAPANAAMADVSFGGIGLVGQGSATPIVTPAVPAGPTAREFFGGFARRAAQVAVAVVAVATSQPEHAEDNEPVTAISSGASWPLDALFGAAHDVRDLHQAETLAGVGTFAGPDGGTGLEALFTAQAAPARRAVPRASEMLKFDQFFQAPGAPAAESAPSAPAAPEGSSGPSGDDLDKFQGWLKGLKT